MVTTVMLAVVSPTKEVSIACQTSLLRLQGAAAQRADLRLEITLEASFNDALNAPTAADWVVVVDWCTGFPPEFVFGLLESAAAGAGLVAGVYPLPTVDWERVGRVLGVGGGAARASREPIAHAGNVYNVVLENTFEGRYAPVAEARELGVLAVAKDVLEAVASPAISYTAPDGKTRYLYAHASVFEDALQTDHQTFVRRAARPLLADTACPCSLSGPAQFAGSASHRTRLR